MSNAPKIKKRPDDKVRHTINFPGEQRLLAERDIRVWQSLLAPYVVLDIDYSNCSERFEPENEAEKQEIEVKRFSRHSSPGRFSSVHDFSIFGRAFFAAEEKPDIIESMAFYIGRLGQDQKGESLTHTITSIFSSNPTSD
jgi:hypothetical protein